MSEQRKQWIRTRFGDMDEKILGQIKEVRDISWPDLVKEYEIKGHTLKWQMVRDIEKSAERIAEIYRNGIDEMVGNSEFMGGSDNRYYRQNVVYYCKLYGDGKKYLQKCDTMVLTEKAEKLVKVVKELWTK